MRVLHLSHTQSMLLLLAWGASHGRGRRLIDRHAREPCPENDVVKVIMTPNSIDSLKSKSPVPHKICPRSIRRIRVQRERPALVARA